MHTFPSRNAAAHKSSGFTLVELLVVIGIIAILAGVALGPITNGIKKAQESGAMQTTRTIALAEFQYANDNNGSYPDGGSVAALGASLMNGNYITDPSIFYLAADKTATVTKATSVASFAAGNCSFDFTGVSDKSGVGASAPDQLPLVWDEGDAACKITGGGVGVYIMNTAATGVFGADGKAVCYHSNNSFFRTPYNGTAPAAGGHPAVGEITFIDQTFNPPATPTYAVLAGASGK